jgi:hypothetical protein
MSDRQAHPLPLDYPELIIGIAGPIGVDMDLLAKSIGSALNAVSYSSTLIKLTSEMARYPITRRDLLEECSRWKGSDTFNTYMRKMSEANALRKRSCGTGTHRC